MISEYSDWDFRSCNVWSKMFEGFQDSEEFTFIDVIVSFGQHKGV